MENIKRELEIRKVEIINYIDFIKRIDHSKSSIVNSDEDLEENPDSSSRIGRPLPECIINDDIKKMLKANLYILLYNVTEAFLKQSILTVLERINEQYTYSKLSDTMKILWLDKCVKWFKYKSPEIERSNTNLQVYYADFIKDLQGKLLVFLTDEDKEDKKLFAEKFGIPGNVDHKIFKQIAKEYGISLNDGSLHKKEADLENLRLKRNNLAHGNISFSEFGKDLSIPDLQRLSNDIFDYLDKTADIFNLYLDDEEFLCKNNN